MPDKLRRVSTPTRLTRAISVIAHVDHGKTTLSDRLLEYTGTVAPRDMVEQVLDQLELERERGFTIKAQAVRMLYKADDGQTYQINLIDTPGHVDFSYEVSRALAACDGAILVVDASQGIEAQTLANVHQALEHHLKIVPVVNKIDLPQANPELVREEIEKVIGLPAESVIFASARQGIGTKEILQAVVREVPPPTGDPAAPLRALIFDAKFDAYRGVVTYVRVLEGTLRKGVRAQMMQTGKSFEVDEVGIFRPQRTDVDDLSAREVVYLIANIGNLRDSGVGDSTTAADQPRPLPHPSDIESISEPIVLASIVVPSAYVGNMMQLSQERRGQYLNTVYEPGDRVVLTYRMPLAEIIHDYYDQLKSRSKGYASLDYELVGFEEANLVKLDVLVAGSPVDALSMIVDRSKAQQQGRRLAEKLKTLIPRQLYEVPIQAAIGGKIVARETVPAMRKDVTAKCYGGDVTRKRKLLEKQKEGKKRLKRVGNVEIPQEAFMAVLSLD